ncbi:unnamed protein product [Ectocarpus sp. 4 AP-2014]
MAKMGVTRKLQTEIDRTLKKVDEGVALFDEIWDKVYSATQQNQKEKYEGDLKKEIKKLQRHRDSIKGWLQSNDIKDKTILLEVRRRIESKMEQFKVCEKETKTKKFSKEGLAREAEMDPEEKEKMEKRDWLTEKIQMLNTQLEGFEADVEKAMAALGKKKKAKDDERINALDNARKQHNYHIGRLEQMLRLLDNNDLAPDQVDSIIEDLDWYISQAGDDIHLIEKFEAEDSYDLYEALELDELAAPGAPPVVKGSKKLDVYAEGDEEDEDSDEDEPPAPTVKLRGKKGKAAAAAAAAAGIPLIGRPVVKNAKDAKTSAPAAGGRQRATTTASGMPIIGRPVVSAAVPTAKVAKAPGLGDSPQAPTQQQQQQQAGPSPAGQQQSTMAAAARMGTPGPQTPGQTMQSATTTPIKMGRMTSAADAMHTPQRQQGVPVARTPPSASAVLNNNAGTNVHTPSRQGPPQPQHASPAAFQGAAGAGQSPYPNNHQQAALPQQQQQQVAQAGGQQKQQQQQQQQQQAQMQQQQQQQQQGGQPFSFSAQQQQQMQMQPQQQHAAAAAQQQQAQAQQQRAGQSGLKGDPGLPLDSPQMGAAIPADDDPSGVSMGLGLGQHHTALGTARQSAESGGRVALEQSMMFKPQSRDSERAKPYVPRNPYRTPTAFPSQPAAAFEKPHMFEKLNTDTLFLIFYYQQGSYQQYLAARELKRQSWRYHKKYMTWFQRHEEPKVTTDDYEQGTYVYFDYETGWCQRIKSDFRFDYSFLEDEAL